MEKHWVISSQSLIWKDELNKRDKRKWKDKRGKFLAQENIKNRIKNLQTKEWISMELRLCKS